MGVASASSTGAENTEYTPRTDESAPPVGARGEKKWSEGFNYSGLRSFGKLPHTVGGRESVEKHLADLSINNQPKRNFHS